MTRQPLSRLTRGKQGAAQQVPLACLLPAAPEPMCPFGNAVQTDQHQALQIKHNPGCARHQAGPAILRGETPMPALCVPKQYEPIVRTQLPVGTCRRKQQRPQCQHHCIRAPRQAYSNRNRSREPYQQNQGKDTPSRPKLSGLNRHRWGKIPRIRRGGLCHARLNTSVPLVPPKPKLFFTATSMRISRAVLAQ